MKKGSAIYFQHPPTSPQVINNNLSVKEQSFSPDCSSGPIAILESALLEGAATDAALISFKNS